MKRDKELIRDILLYCEKQKGIFDFSFEGKYDADAGTDFEGYKDGDLSGHLKLLIDSDYLDGNYFQAEDGIIYNVTIQSIKEKGYNLLDTIRDKGIWAEVKKELGVAGESWSMDILGKLAGKILAKKLGI